MARVQAPPWEVRRQQRPVGDDVWHQPRLQEEGRRDKTGDGPHFQAGEQEE